MAMIIPITRTASIMYIMTGVISLLSGLLRSKGGYPTKEREKAIKFKGHSLSYDSTGEHCTNS